MGKEEVDRKKREIRLHMQGAAVEAVVMEATSPKKSPLSSSAPPRVHEDEVVITTPLEATADNKQSPLSSPAPPRVHEDEVAITTPTEATADNEEVVTLATEIGSYGEKLIEAGEALERNPQHQALMQVEAEIDAQIKEYERLLLLDSEAASQVQGVIRGQSARGHVMRIAGSSQVLLAALHGHGIRGGLPKLHARCTTEGVVYGVWRGYISRLKIPFLVHQTREEAALVIQGSIAMHGTRRCVDVELAEDMMRCLNDSATVIQGGIRAQGARSQFRSMEDSASELQSALRGRESRSWIKKIEDAAGIIQAGIMVRLGRDEIIFRESEIASERIQGMIHGKMARHKILNSPSKQYLRTRDGIQDLKLEFEDAMRALAKTPEQQRINQLQALLLEESNMLEFQCHPACIIQASLRGYTDRKLCPDRHRCVAVHTLQGGIKAYTMRGVVKALQQKEEMERRDSRRAQHLFQLMALRDEKAAVLQGLIMGSRNRSAVRAALGARDREKAIEIIKGLHLIFVSIDSDGSGSLDEEELSAMLRQHYRSEGVARSKAQTKNEVTKAMKQFADFNTKDRERMLFFEFVTMMCVCDDCFAFRALGAEEKKITLEYVFGAANIHLLAKRIIPAVGIEASKILKPEPAGTRFPNCNRRDAAPDLDFGTDRGRRPSAAPGAAALQLEVAL